MANRNYNRYQALEKEIKELYVKATIGVAGAATMVANQSLGIASIARTAEGIYEITLQDKYMRLMHLDVCFISPTSEDLDAYVTSENVATTKKIVVAVRSAGSPVEVADGDTLLISIKLKNSSI
jgi:hypothetical protein